MAGEAWRLDVLNVGTDKGPSGSGPRAAVRRSRRNSLWPLVIVVAVPLLAVVLGLRLMYTALLLIAGTVLLAFSPHLRGGDIRDPKRAWAHLVACYTSLQAAHAALQRSPADAGARRRFMDVLDECESLLRSRPGKDWGSDVEYVAKVGSEVEALASLVPGPAAGPEPKAGPELGPLTDLRLQGLISESEFRAFSARLSTMAADKMWDVLETIAGFRFQCGQRTLTEADFHAALQGLLCRLDEPDGGVAPGLLPQLQDAIGPDACPDPKGLPGCGV